jgi:hypothetical protein
MSAEEKILTQSREVLSKATSNGLYYYFLELGYIPFLDANDCTKTDAIATPFGTDKSKWFWLEYDKSKCEWIFCDETNPQYTGNIFDFVALKSARKLPRDEKLVCHEIGHKINIQKFSSEQLQELASLEVTSINQKHPILDHVRGLYSFDRKVLRLSQLDPETGRLPSSFYNMSTEASPKQTVLKPKRSFRTANERLEDAKNQPDIRPYMDVFIQDGELVFLFADTGKGKSVLAVQIADAISKGNSIMGLENRMLPRKVLFYDFELSDKQFGNRYIDPDSKEAYSFSDNLMFIELDLIKIAEDKTAKFEELLINKIGKDVSEKKGDVLIIDNISFLSMQDAQDGQVAQVLMKYLDQLKHSLGLTILVLAHTTKRNISSISVNDMAGSKKLVNFADGIIALGQCKSDPTNRYLKQVKARSSVTKFGEENVLECTIVKKDAFLGFENLGFCSEKELLKAESGDEELQEKKEEVYAMYLNGKTCRQIEEEKGIGKSTVNRWINEVKKSVPCPTVPAP